MFQITGYKQTKTVGGFVGFLTWKCSRTSQEHRNQIHYYVLLFQQK